MKTLRLTNAGLQEVNYSENEVMVFLSGKPLSGALNQLPLSMGGGKVMNFYRGNCAGAKPFQFKGIELAVDAFKKVRWEKEGRKENAKVFSGNLWIGNIVNDEFEPLEKPMMQLL
jgi:hypothetical protein